MTVKELSNNKLKKEWNKPFHKVTERRLEVMAEMKRRQLFEKQIASNINK